MCGIFGIVSNQDVARPISLGLYDLQHRGEQGAGIVIFDGGEYHSHKREGLVTEVFPEQIIEKLRGNFGIGHTRYSTIGDLKREEMFFNIQPLEGEFQGDSFWVAHNGNLVGLEPLKKEVEEKGYHFRTTSDTEVIVGLISVSLKKDFLEALLEVLPKLRGGFALAILYKDKVIGVRDRYGIRPLCLGRDEASFILASESCAFHTLQGHFLFDIRPGEIIVLDENGINTQLIWAENPQLRLCIFELIYFARPDSVIDGQSVYFYRKRAGEILAKEHPVEADIVIAVPASGEIYDLGFSQVSGIPLEKGIFRNRYFSTRTFLTRRGTDRTALQRIKLHPLRKVVHEKRVVVKEDSIIRGNVSPAIVVMLREEGAREVHVRVGSSPIRHPCYFGVDMATYGELIAASLEAEGVRKYIQADSLGYLSLEGMVKASGFKRENLDLGCFIGEYPFEIK
jgi:amidophosphoribosyltransferase